MYSHQTSMQASFPSIHILPTFYLPVAWAFSLFDEVRIWNLHIIMHPCTSFLMLNAPPFHPWAASVCWTAYNSPETCNFLPASSLSYYVQELCTIKPMDWKWFCHTKWDATIIDLYLLQRSALQICWTLAFRQDVWKLQTLL